MLNLKFYQVKFTLVDMRQLEQLYIMDVKTLTVTEFSDLRKKKSNT